MFDEFCLTLSRGGQVFVCNCLGVYDNEVQYGMAQEKQVVEESKG